MSATNEMVYNTDIPKMEFRSVLNAAFHAARKSRNERAHPTDLRGFS